MDTSRVIAGRLRAVARERGLNTSFVLKRWLMERFLARLSASEQRDRFLLKGGALFSFWTGGLLRSTADLDLQAVDARDAGVASLFLLKSIATPLAHADGIAFEPEGARFRVLKGSAIPGERLVIPARFEGADVYLGIDTVFGNPVTPGPEVRWLAPLLREFDPFIVHCYPRETVLAEKLATAVEFGADNTRLRDYFDISFLIGRYAFQGHVLAAAIEATFASRDAHRFLDGDESYWAKAFAPEYATPSREVAWRNWLGMHAPASDGPCLQATVGSVARFAMPLLIAARDRRIAPRSWDPRVGWTNRGGWTVLGALPGAYDVGILQGKADLVVGSPMLRRHSVPGASPSG